MSGASSDEHGALIREIGAAVQSALGSLATVTESPPDSTWQVSRLMIRPTSADAPAMGVWPEDEVIYISVADRVAARVDVTEGDPLTDITATRAIHALVQRGRYLDRSALDSLLTATAAIVAQMPALSP